jgi:hypothetical protein
MQSDHLKIPGKEECEAWAYQEERRNHKGEKLSVVLLAYTVVKPLQKSSRK